RDPVGLGGHGRDQQPDAEETEQHPADFHVGRSVGHEDPLSFLGEFLGYGFPTKLCVASIPSRANWATVGSGSFASVSSSARSSGRGGLPSFSIAARRRERLRSEISVRSFAASFGSSGAADSQPASAARRTCWLYFASVYLSKRPGSDGSSSFPR